MGRGVVVVQQRDYQAQLGQILDTMTRGALSVWERLDGQQREQAAAGLQYARARMQASEGGIDKLKAFEESTGQYREQYGIPDLDQTLSFIQRDQPPAGAAAPDMTERALEAAAGVPTVSGVPLSTPMGPPIEQASPAVGGRTPAEHLRTQLGDQPHMQPPTPEGPLAEIAGVPAPEQAPAPPQPSGAMQYRDPMMRVAASAQRRMMEKEGAEAEERHRKARLEERVQVVREGNLAATKRRVMIEFMRAMQPGGGRSVEAGMWNRLKTWVQSKNDIDKWDDKLKQRFLGEYRAISRDKDAGFDEARAYWKNANGAWKSEQWMKGRGRTVMTGFRFLREGYKAKAMGADKSADSMFKLAFQSLNLPPGEIKELTDKAEHFGEKELATEMSKAKLRAIYAEAAAKAREVASLRKAGGVGLLELPKVQEELDKLKEDMEAYEGALGMEEARMFLDALLAEEAEAEAGGGEETPAPSAPAPAPEAAVPVAAPAPAPAPAQAAPAPEPKAAARLLRRRARPGPTPGEDKRAYFFRLKSLVPDRALRMALVRQHFPE